MTIGSAVSAVGGLFSFLLLALPAAAGQGEPPVVPAEVARCPEGRPTCLAVHLYLATADERPVATPEWVAEQVENANRLFAEVGIGFHLAAIELLPEGAQRIASREERDLLGRQRHSFGPVLLFVTGRLDNVDEPGEIYGVHWRDRQQTSRRWIILSAISRPLTLTHELGHFFGLPHSDRSESVMCKSGRRLPAPELGFTASEQKRMKERLKTMLKRKRVTHLPGALP